MPSKIQDSVMDAGHSLHVVSPTENHSHTVIFLHGRDSIASEFAAEFLESQASDDHTFPEIFPSVKWVFPSAKVRTSAKFGDIPQWFDIWDVENPLQRKELQTEGLRESIAFILDIIRNEALLVPPERIVLAGISQGCATAIHALLYGGIKLGAFIGLCGWLPFQDDIDEIGNRSSSDFNLLQNIRGLFKDPKSKPIMPLMGLFPGRAELAFKTPVFLSHSREDHVVPVHNGERLSWELEELGFGVEWKTYSNRGTDPHWINEPKGVDHIVSFLRRHVTRT